MRLLVAGSRSFATPPEGVPPGFLAARRGIVWRFLDTSLEWLTVNGGGLWPEAVIHGGARGIDTWAGEWATGNQFKIEIYPALWKVHGKGAGFIRNKRMVEECDAAIIVHDGESRGTTHTLTLMETSDKPYLLFELPLTA